MLMQGVNKSHSWGFSAPRADGSQIVLLTTFQLSFFSRLLFAQTRLSAQLEN
jgi:hypothetical protein